MEINIKRDQRGGKIPPKDVFEQIIKTNKPLNRLIKKKKKREDTNYIRNERGVTSTHSTIFKRYEDIMNKLVNKSDNLNEMNKFSERL